MIEQNDLELAERMREATGTFVRQVRQGAGTPSEARLTTLAFLERQGRPVSAAELARERRVTHQSTRVLLGQMADDHLVQGAPDPHDGRSVLFSITSDGKEALAQSRAARASWIADRWIKTLSQEEKAALHTTIESMQRISDSGLE